MALLSFSNISFFIAARPIFENTSFQISKNDRIGLVGANGRGKTTLLRLMMKTVSPDAGEVNISNKIKIGYLPQEVEIESDGSAMDYLLDSAGINRNIEEEIEALGQELDEASDLSRKEVLAIKLSDLHEELMNLESSFSTHEAEIILSGLGFSKEEFAKPVSHFSGGWKMRIMLASLLFSKPDLLLLDEPTNHLDLPSMAWLDTYLSAYKKAFLIISHDRDFLDRHVNRIFSIEPEAFKQYKGNYTQSRVLRLEEERVLQNRQKNVNRERKQLERFVERFKAKANKARQAKSKSKLIDKLEKVETLKSESQITFSFPDVERSGDRVLALKNVSKSFGDLHLYKNFSQVVMRGDKIGIVGVNGSGKTTLLKMIADELSIDNGEIEFGSNVGLSYYAQHQAQALDLQKNVLDEVRTVAPSLGDTKVRSVLGAFLFRGNDVEKSVGVLSGGEKARVALAKLLVAPENLLLMDEPTNHLDLESSESLATALEQFGGTVLFVSHNRSWIDRLATKIWEINDGNLTVFPGNLTEYMSHLEERKEKRIFTKEDLHDVEKSVKSKTVVKKEIKETKVEKKRREAKYRELVKKKAGPIKQKIEKIEKRIDEIELRNSELEKIMVDPDLYGSDEFVHSLKEFRQNEDKVEELMGRWSYHSKLLEEKMKEIDNSKDDDS
jgi:ATP-binding cassette, subfamily F, member 3